ncbi:MAG: TetR/AcrR family transcriptional regulator [Pseudomonadota bacterium]|nr:TetR/AcrR family transcriptional regulator [Pseudomonadota bacterium]
MTELASKSIGRPVSFDRTSTIEAATELYWQSGVAATSFNEVSRVLGVSKPTLYRYFGDEDGLVSAAIQHYVNQRTLHTELLNATGDLRTDLNAWFDKQIDDLYERTEDASMPTGCLLMECVQLGKALGEKSTATVREAVIEFLGMFEERLKIAREAGQLRPGIDLDAAVRLVAGQTIIAKNVVLIGEPKENLKRMVALAIDGIIA